MGVIRKILKESIYDEIGLHPEHQLLMPATEDQIIPGPLMKLILSQPQYRKLLMRDRGYSVYSEGTLAENKIYRGGTIRLRNLNTDPKTKTWHRRLTNQRLIDRFIRESIRCQNS